ncbi:hypothetical protein PC118_g17109 [Phytophthora cactorum]|uniref:Uncharacterized protein n=1 Tax=Phytophthora cactorum TaxID=29920 RepID=A0A8T1FCG4_9STRA|nr:hypothetical protein PC118_g17109 [Phytophthora cactorum]
MPSAGVGGRVINNVAIISQTSLEQNQHEGHEPVKQANTPDQKQSKRRKCTYAARREKAQELREEVRRLESQVVVLKLRSGEVGQESGVDNDLKQTQEENAKLSESIRTQHLQVAEVQSVMSQYLRSQHFTLSFIPEKAAG